MKQLIHGIVLFAVFAATVFMIITLNGRRQRVEENAETLSSAIETTVQNLLQEGTYSVENDEEFIADFIQALCVQMNSDTEIEANILRADAQKGLLSVEVKAIYQHPNGREGVEACYRTILFDTKEAIPAETYTVTYYYGRDGDEEKDIYKQYTVLEGEELPVPKAPEPLSGTGSFEKWKNRADDTDAVLSNRKVTENLEFYARFR